MIHVRREAPTLDDIPLIIEETMSVLADMVRDVNFIAEDLDDTKNQLTIAQVATIIERIETIRKVLAVTSRDVMLAGTALIPKDEKTVTWKSEDGQEFTTELKWSSRRTAVAKDELLSAVKETARTVDTDTGEVVVDYRNLLTTVEKAYRLEPRWSEIKTLGINPDEFCQTKYEPSLTTTPKGQEQ